MKEAVNIFWFRRDLRLNDNAGLYYALKAGKPVVPIFIFDRKMLERLEDPEDRRVSFIYTAVEQVQNQLLAVGSDLRVFYGIPVDIFADLLTTYQVEKVFL